MRARLEVVGKMTEPAPAVSRSERQGGVHFALRGYVGRLRAYSAKRGLRATLAALGRNVVQRLVRYQHHFIWEEDLTRRREPSAWAADEQFSILGPDNIDGELSPSLREYLGGDGAAGDIEGVRKGDRLLLVRARGKYVYSGYIYFETTGESRRQKKIYAEDPRTPVIGTCVSAPLRIWTESAQTITSSEALRKKVQGLLGEGEDLAEAARDFKDLGQFVYTAFVSHELKIPFPALKTLVCQGKPLWRAAQELKPGVDGMAVARRAWDESSVHRRVLNEVFRYLRNLGYARAINEVLAHNLASSNANIAVGMRVCRELRDWIVCKRVVIQRVSESGRTDWRVFRI